MREDGSAPLTWVLMGHGHPRISLCHPLCGMACGFHGGMPPTPQTRHPDGDMLGHPLFGIVREAWSPLFRDVFMPGSTRRATATPSVIPFGSTSPPDDDNGRAPTPQTRHSSPSPPDRADRDVCTFHGLRSILAHGHEASPLYARVRPPTPRCTLPTPVFDQSHPLFYIF